MYNYYVRLLKFAVLRIAKRRYTMRMQLVLTPELLLEAYRQGLFPMAYHAESPHVHWLCPEMRGQLSIEELHIPQKLLKTIIKNTKQDGPYRIRINTAFEAVILACGEATFDRPETWINKAIRKTCLELHRRGQAHSVECWRADPETGKEILVGGLYGISMGAVFFGESMFSRETGTSKIALVHLAARLRKGGFTLLDAQFVNDHLKQFGAYEVPKSAYLAQLKKAITQGADFKLEGISEQDLISEYLDSRPKTD
jgi:leucyl/phenylalanyl-tRNA--protein transferase